RRQIISTPISDTPAQLYVLTGFLYVTGGYVYQMIYDCEYGDNITDMVFLVKNIFNQKINTLYDSRVGKYVGFGEYGMTNAAHYNSQKWKMDERKVEVETLCRYNARLFRRSTLDRKVPPVVKVHETKPADYGKRSMLECSVMGFFPQEVRLSWLRDGVEVTTDVSSTDVLANGDWSFQLHSYLEFTPRRGERVSCRVEHSSLRESLEVDWGKGLHPIYFCVQLG
uniref:Ig-like domain-containing protein n=1 Tax=Sander lucioperca TaxID=283035 RepID=A0A8C9YFN8_SANLU